MINDSIDPAHYGQQAGRSFGSAKEAADHYIEEGAAADLDPNPWFATRWYRWQNPISTQNRTPLHHFIRRGRDRMLDPSPMVDFRHFIASVGAADPEAAWARLLRSGGHPTEGVYRSPADLHRVQADFLDATMPYLLNDSRTTPRRSLVFLQNRSSDRIEEWCSRSDRSYDVWVNSYDGTERDGPGDLRSAQVGTKFTAVHQLHALYGDLFTPYDHVWLLDDDIDLTGEQIERAFSIVRRTGALLAQPALTERSHCVWDALKQQGSTHRQLNTVEIMMPIVEQRLLADAAPEWSRSISGFGLDLLLGDRCRERGGIALVLDEVVVEHLADIDQANGEYYQFLRRNGINAKAELWEIARERAELPHIGELQGAAT